MLRLAAPLALTELGWLAMSFTDTVMVGRLPDSATAIGAVSLGSTLFYTIGVFGSGVMLGMDTLVAQAYGARKLEECHRIMWNSLYLAGAIAPLLMLSVLLLLPLFPRVGLEPALVAQTVPFLKALVWSTLPLALYFALRRYLQAMHIVKPVVFALISANLVNLLGNWVLVYGHLGARSHGVAGSGWSTCISRAYMVAVLAKRHNIPFYVAAPLSTVDLATATGDDIPIEERDAKEVTHVQDHQMTPDGVGVHNFAFDVTPNELIAAIITDRGIARPPYSESLRTLAATHSAHAP